MSYDPELDEKFLRERALVEARDKLKRQRMRQRQLDTCAEIAFTVLMKEAEHGPIELAEQAYKYALAMIAEREAQGEIP